MCGRLHVAVMMAVLSVHTMLQKWYKQLGCVYSCGVCVRVYVCTCICVYVMCAYMCVRRVDA